MTKTIPQVTVKETRRRERQGKRWEDNLKDWTIMNVGKSVGAVEDRVG